MTLTYHRLLLSGLAAAAMAPCAASPWTGKASPEQTAETVRRHIKAQRALPSVPTLATGDLGRAQNPLTRPYTQAPQRLAPRQVTSYQASRIYGGAIYADSWTSTEQPVGIYSFERTDGSTLVPEAVGDDYVVTGGGVYANGKYHYVTYMSFMGMILANLCTVDIDTWEMERYLPVQAGAVAQDMAWDPVTGMAYGCFMNDNADGWVFGALDLESGERIWLSDLDIIMLSVGVNSLGEVYAVGLDGNLYRFDKNDGSRTLVGPTGRRPMYSASGCFDLTDDTFYWECIEGDSKGRLYVVDTTTGAAEYVTDIADNMEMTGMFIPVADAPDMAPDRVSDIALDFDGDALSGTVSFVMPSGRFGSAEALGECSWHIAVDGSEQCSGTAMPGAAVSGSVSVPQPGACNLSVWAANADGRGPVESGRYWIGADTPCQPENVSVARGATPGDIVLTWDAPTQTEHGGWFDSAGLTYNVVRQPGGIAVASGVSERRVEETLDADGDFTVWHYEITAVSGDTKSRVATSRNFGVGVVALPFGCGFETEDDFDLFTVEDTNNDGETWLFDEISQKARIKYYIGPDYQVNEMDDWMFSPGLRLEPGWMYRVAMTSNCYHITSREQVEVCMGTMPASAAMDTQVVKKTQISSADPRPLSGYVTVDEPGVYYIGVHGCSPSDQFYLYVDDFSVDRGPAIGTPGAVSSLRATAAPEGRLEATLSFKTPSKTVDGLSLESIDRVTITRNGQTVAVLEGVNTGEKMEIVDSEGEQGDNLYEVTCANGKGEGLSASVSVYLGHDRPGLPLNVKAVAFGSDVILTWDAPAEGESGGWFDPAALTYTVVRANDEVELAAGVTGLTFTDANAPTYGYRQEFLQYYVFAESPAGYGYGQVSNTVAVGEAYELPFRESFAGGTITNDPWDVSIPEESDGWWRVVGEGEYPAAMPQDKDGGMVTFMPEESGDSGTLTSGKIALDGAEHPVLDFWWFYPEDSTDRITVRVNGDDRGFDEVARVEFRREAGQGWKKAVVDLGAYADCEVVQIALEAVSATGYTNIHIDNIRVHESYDDNLAMAGLKVPARAMTGEKVLVTATVENVGNRGARDFAVTLLCNGEAVQSITGDWLDAGALCDYTFEIVPTPAQAGRMTLQAELVYGPDQFAGDNLSESAAMQVRTPNYPAVSDLEGALDNGAVTLAWSEPDTTPGEQVRLEDGAETYRAFTVTDMGEWTLVDRDGDTTIGIQGPNGQPLVYENAGAPMAFMAFNPALAGIALEYEDGTPTEWAPHSGEQMFAAFACGHRQNDDWLISPLLPGMAQEVSFWAKSVTNQYGFEKYEVYTSATGIEPEDFTIIGSLRSAPVEWVRETVQLPEGTRYFAIRCVSDDCFALLLDDFSFFAESTWSGELSLIGYNVWRDGQLLTAEPIMEQEYTETLDGRHSYNVTVVYDRGESAMSNTVVMDNSGVAALGGSVAVYGGCGVLAIDGAGGREVTLTDAAGLVQRLTPSSDRCRVAAGAGVWLVTIDGRRFKALVR